ncbi:HalOD1 output domain-containing protein [Natronorubrum texcoconense]|uniref:Halobacterial output domain-containing protein n=1 Tax=Natronorubrum texcoconense TaxID=1095776 RepID=A0A1G8XDK4_9EURY|nr:HalOD1 output domain-containing protein [Natronorubrum texcoconense]SDJ88688.1 hypothetical protein SAMN04515672_1714 [Natronorubrum texcoconense]
MDEGDSAVDGSQVDSYAVELQKTYDWSATPPSTAAVTALATAMGVDPTELATERETTLHDYVNSDALDALVRDQQSEQVTVSFTVDRYRIWFDGDELSIHSHNR